MTTQQTTSRDWPRAVRALRALLDSPDSTEFAAEVFDALDPDIARRTRDRIRAEAAGRLLLEERPSLLAALTDRQALERLDEGSLGRAYLQHLDRNGLDPEKLLRLQDDTVTRAHATEPDVDWVLTRSQLMHDLSHVLTGYGADGPGESRLLLFTLAQAGGAANALLALGANFNMVRENGVGWLAECWRAWRRGRRATCLAALPFERLLPLPLADARRIAAVD